MPVNYSANRIRNNKLFEAWDALDDKVFEELGVSRDSLKELQTGLQGYLVLPGDPNYNADRMLSNPLFDYYPAVIAYCVVDSDATLVLAAALAAKLQFSVRSGGHCTAGFSSGPGVLIDVSKLKSIHIDKNALTATVGCGVKFGDFNAELNANKLHVPGGECPDVCIGGYVQGGGYGFTSVTFGMNCDNVISMKVLLVDGTTVIASSTQNYDLWWAMRGGTGGNFGILLSVTYQLRKLDYVFGWALIWPLENPTDIANAADAMMLLQDQYMKNSPYAPDLNIQVSFCYQSIIHEGQPPGELKPYFMVRGLYVGNAKQGGDAIAPLQALPGCISQWTSVQPYVVMNDMLLNTPQGMPPVADSALEAKTCRLVNKLMPHDFWIKQLNYYCDAEPNTVYLYLEFYGGAIAAAKSKEENAFIHRDALYNAVLDVFWPPNENGSKANVYLDGWTALMEPAWSGEVYQNYPRLGNSNYAQEYWAGATPALSVVKNKYDPNNYFTFAQQVPLVDTSSKIDESQVPDKVQKSLNQPIDHKAGIKPETTAH